MPPESPVDNEAIRELRDELKDLNISLKRSSDTTNRFTLAMFILAFVQVLLALFQLLLSFIYPDNIIARQIFGVFMIIVTLVILVYFFKRIDPPKD